MSTLTFVNTLTHVRRHLFQAMAPIVSIALKVFRCSDKIRIHTTITSRFSLFLYSVDSGQVCVHRSFVVTVSREKKTRPRFSLCAMHTSLNSKVNLLTSDALVATELILGERADSGLAFNPYGYRTWKYDGCCCCCCWFESDGRYGGKLMLDSTFAVAEPLLLLQSPIDDDEPAITFVDDEDIVFRCWTRTK